MLPGPVTRSTGSQSRRPRCAVGEHRDAWAPPTAYTSSTPSRAQAARIVRRVRQPADSPSAAGEATASDADAGLLRGHDVHDHAGRVDGQAAGHVQADPLDRHPALGDRAAGDDLGRDVGAALVAVDQPGAPDGLLQRGAHGRVEPRRGRACSASAGTRRRSSRTPSNRSRVVAQRRGAAMAHVLADRAAPSPGRPRRRARRGAAGPQGAPSGGRPRRSRVDIMASSLGSGSPARPERSQRCSSRKSSNPSRGIMNRSNRLASGSATSWPTSRGSLTW